ncbi:methyltransferase domain-containing protein [bacterium]|nr:MAG: methyltransferase domain-containing protein [bacterium]
MLTCAPSSGALLCASTTAASTVAVGCCAANPANGEERSTAPAISAALNPAYGVVLIVLGYPRYAAGQTATGRMTYGAKTGKVTIRTHRFLAAAYDRLNAGTERRILAPWRKRLVGDLHGEIVEVGAGTGATFACYPSGASVLALEPDPAMLAQAQRKLGEGIAHITLRLGGDDELDRLPASSADAVVFFLVLCSIDDPARALRRARRVLRPNGSLLIIEHVRSAGLLGTVQDALTPLWSRLTCGCHLNRRTVDTLAEAGFDAETLSAVHLPIPFPVRDLVAGALRAREEPLRSIARRFA